MTTHAFRAARRMTVSVVAAGLAAVLPFAARAQDHGIIVNCAYDSGAGGPPDLNCVLEQLVFISKAIFGIAGSAALVAFVIGGFFYITATDSKGIARAKAWVTNAVYGIVIILTSAYVIQYGVTLLEGKS